MYSASVRSKRFEPIASRNATFARLKSRLRSDRILFVYPLAPSPVDLDGGALMLTCYSFRSALVAHRVRIVEVVALLGIIYCGDKSFPSILFGMRTTLLRSFGNLPVDRYATFPH